MDSRYAERIKSIALEEAEAAPYGRVNDWGMEPGKPATVRFGWERLKEYFEVGARYIDAFPRGALRVDARSFHIVVGATLIAIVLARLAWRRSGGRDPWNRGCWRLQRRAGRRRFGLKRLGFLRLRQLRRGGRRRFGRLAQGRELALQCLLVTLELFEPAVGCKRALEQRKPLLGSLHGRGHLAAVREGQGSRFES